MSARLRLRLVVGVVAGVGLLAAVVRWWTQQHSTSSSSAQPPQQQQEEEKSAEETKMEVKEDSMDTQADASHRRVQMTICFEERELVQEMEIFEGDGLRDPVQDEEHEADAQREGSRTQRRRAREQQGTLLHGAAAHAVLHAFSHMHPPTHSHALTKCWTLFFSFVLCCVV